MTAALEGDEWSASRPVRTLPPGKTRYPFYRRLGGPQGRSGRGRKSRPHRHSIPHRPARSQSLYRLSRPAHHMIYISCNDGRHTVTKTFTTLHYTCRVIISVTICTAAWYDDEIMEDEMGVAYGVHGREKRCMQNIGEKI